MFFSNLELDPIRKRPRKIVQDEIAEMRAQMKEDPYSEPEPTSRFDRMTPAERYIVAEELGL